MGKDLGIICSRHISLRIKSGSKERNLTSAQWDRHLRDLRDGQKLPFVIAPIPVLSIEFALCKSCAGKTILSLKARNELEAELAKMRKVNKARRKENDKTLMRKINLGKDVAKLRGIATALKNKKQPIFSAVLNDKCMYNLHISIMYIIYIIFMIFPNDPI